MWPKVTETQLHKQQEHEHEHEHEQPRERMGAEDANRRLQKRLSRPSDNWVDVVMAALVGDPVFYGVIVSIAVCMLAFIGLVAAKVLIDQIEEEEQREKREQRRTQRERDGEQDEDEEDEDELEGKKEQ